MTGRINSLIKDILDVEDLRVVSGILDIPLSSKIDILLSPLKLSTITVGGALSNVSFNEEKNWDKLTPHGDVLAVSCNYYEARLKKNGEVDHVIWEPKVPYPKFPEEPRKTIDGKLLTDTQREAERIRINKIREQYLYAKLIPPRKSNRGRKKQEKRVKKRKIQGSGKCFNSGAQFTVKGIELDRPDKYYKIKVYRNGSFTIPGVLCEDLGDIKIPLQIVADFFSRAFNTDTRVIRQYIIMQNYKCKVLLDDTKLNIDALRELIFKEKTLITSLSAKYGINIAEITYYADKYSGLTMKFWRKDEHGSDAKTEKGKDKDESKDKDGSKDEGKDVCEDKDDSKDKGKDEGKDESKDESKDEGNGEGKDESKDEGNGEGKDESKDEGNGEGKSKRKRKSKGKKGKTDGKRNKNKKTTVKILQSCKINIDGAIQKSEVENIWHWLNELLLENYRNVVYDLTELLPHSDSSDTDDTEYDDIYEDYYHDKYEDENSDHGDDSFEYVIKDVKTEIVKAVMIDDKQCKL